MSDTVATPRTRVVHAEAPVHRAPSGLPYREIAGATLGSAELFVAEQTLAPGESVPRHTHPVEEVICVLEGSGRATLGDGAVEIGPGVSLIVPPGLTHGFANDGSVPLRVLIIFPGSSFAPTTRVESPAGAAGPARPD